MTDNSLNISNSIRFEIKSPPRGMTDYDPKALTVEQQNELNEYKLIIRRENLLYFERHPEIKALTSMIIRMTVTQKPRNVTKFIGNIFARSEREIREDVNKILQESELLSTTIPYCNYDEWDY